MRQFVSNEDFTGDIIIFDPFNNLPLRGRRFKDGLLTGELRYRLQALMVGDPTGPVDPKKKPGGLDDGGEDDGPGFEITLPTVEVTAPAPSTPTTPGTNIPFPTEPVRPAPGGPVTPNNPIPIGGGGSTSTTTIYPPVLAPGDRLCKYSFYYKNVSETDAFYATYMNGMRIENSTYFHTFPATLFYLANGTTNSVINSRSGADYFGQNKTPFKYLQDFFPGLIGTDIYSKDTPGGKVWYFTPKAAEEISAFASNLAGQITANLVPDAANPTNPLTESTWYGIANALIKTFIPGSNISPETPTRINGATNSNAVYDKNCK